MPLLESGLSLSYRMEMLSEGRRSEERLRLTVLESIGPEQWLLELSLDEVDARYRARYRSGGSASAFADSRFDRVESWDGAWRPIDSDELDFLASLRDMEGRVGGRTFEAESTLTVGSGELVCRRFTFADSSVSVQEGESVTLRTRLHVRGVVWLCDELPFGGWVRYHEDRRAQKTSEFAGRSFAGNEERSRETWTLESIHRGEGTTRNDSGGARP